MSEYTTIQGQKIRIEIGETELTVLRFPNYRGGSDSPKAVPCKGKVVQIKLDGQYLVGITIQTSDPKIQPNEVVIGELGEGKISADALHVYLNFKAAYLDYAEMIEQDLQESVTELHHLQKRIERIRAERDILQNLITQDSSGWMPIK